MMMIRKPSEYFDQYEILLHLNRQSFCQTYLVSHRDTHARFYLVEYDLAGSPPQFQEEIRLWTSSRSFPAIVQQWSDAKQLSILVSEFQAVCISDLADIHSGKFLEPEITALFFDLCEVFQDAYHHQIKLGDPEFFLQKLFHTLSRKLIFLPSPLLLLFEPSKQVLGPLRKNLTPVSAARYIQNLSEIFFYLLLGHFPKPGENFAYLTQMGEHKEKLLQKMIAGKIESFEGLVSSFSSGESEITLKTKPGLGTAKNRAMRFAKSGRLPKVSAGAAKAANQDGKNAVFLLKIFGGFYLRPVRALFPRIRGVLLKLGLLHFLERTKLFKIRRLQTWLSARKPLDEGEFFRFTQCLAVMINSGIPLAKALNTLSRQTRSARLKQALSDLHGEVLVKGLSLSGGMESHPDVFPEAYVNMVKAGETGGKLETVLEEVAGYLDRNLRLRQKVKSASTYPLLVALICVALFGVFLYVILPRILALVTEDSNVSSPFPTRMLMGIVHFAHSPSILILCIPLALFVLPLRAFYRTAPGQEALDSFKMNAPVFGSLYKKFLLTEFCSTLGSLLRSGVSFAEALNVAGGVSASRLFNKVAAQIKERIMGGASLSGAIAKIPFYPVLLRSMISAGEVSGNLPEMLIRTSRMYEMEVDYAIRRFLDLLEPLLVIFMGIVVAFVVLAVFLPVYSAISSIAP